MPSTRHARLIDVAHAHVGPLSRHYARAVVALRWWIVAGWVVVCVVCVTVLPGLGARASGGLDGFISLDSPPLQTELRSFNAFGFPLYSRTITVQHDREGLSGWTQARAALLAAGLTRQEYTEVDPILGALPLSNSLPGTPAASDRGTTIITFLFISPTVSFNTQLRAGREVGQRFLSDPIEGYVGVTGTIPARAEQARVINESLQGVELATLAAIVLITAVNFRSLVAPLVTLLVNGVAFVITHNASPYIGGIFDVAVPDELGPLLIALQIGVVTDYVIFFMSGMRRRVRNGETRLDAARNATGEFAHIVLVAGITVAGGTAALLVARSDLFRAFGPGMVMAILIGLAVSITLAPALLAICGRWLFWPRLPSPVSGEEAMAGPGPARFLARAFSGDTVRAMTERHNAVRIAVACIVGMTVMAIPMLHMGLGLSFIPALPSDNPVRQAAAAASDGFAPGITSPTEVLLEGEDVTLQIAPLRRLQTLLEQHNGVAGVLGAGEDVLPLEFGVFLARDHDAARYLLILDDQPLGSRSVDTLSALRAELPELAAQAGIAPDVRVGLAGDTAIAETIVTETKADLLRIAVAALSVNLLLLVLFLRSLVAPLYLLASSVLALLATLGLTTFVFQDLLHHDGLTFYVPFAAAVLLVSLGSDYNIFGVGHIWSEAQRRPLRDALIVGLPQTTRAITAAGITLAVSFGLLALVPLAPFRELAFAMFVGIMLDAVVVRSFLVPALLVLVGRRSGWPGGQLHAPAAEPRPTPS